MLVKCTIPRQKIIKTHKDYKDPLERGTPPPQPPPPQTPPSSAPAAPRLDRCPSHSKILDPPLDRHYNNNQKSVNSIVRQLKQMGNVCRRKDNSDEAALICAGRLFHARAAATGKARGTSSVVVSAERRWQRTLMSAAGCLQDTPVLCRAHSDMPEHIQTA